MSETVFISGHGRPSAAMRAALGGYRTGLEVGTVERALTDALAQVPKTIDGELDVHGIAAFVVNAMKGNQK